MDDAPALAVCSDSVFNESTESLSETQVRDPLARDSLVRESLVRESFLASTDAVPAGRDSRENDVAFDPPTINLPTRIVEALLFASDAPLSANKLAELVGAGTSTHMRLAIAELNDQYTAAGRAFRIEEIARGYQMMTLPEYKPYLAKLNKQRAETRLSDATLETLSIIAYKQPVIRADIEAIRGVACGDQIARLRELGIVRLVGRAEVVGRPMLYGTTRKFLDLFGLAELDDLPPMEALKLRPTNKAGESKPGIMESPAVEPRLRERDDAPASAARRPIVEDSPPTPHAIAGA